MPPAVSRLSTLSIASSKISPTREATSLQPENFTGMLLGPGRYEVRNLAPALPLSDWASAPVTGAIHVGWNGGALVETWVMFASYRPVNLTPDERVIVTCVVAGPPGPLSTFMDQQRASHPERGGIVCSWTYGAAQMIPYRPPEDGRGGFQYRQCLPGEVEIVAISSAGMPGDLLGHVVVTQNPPVTGDWRLGTFTETWTVFPGTAPLATGQSALLRLATSCPIVQGAMDRVWNVVYSAL